MKGPIKESFPTAFCSNTNLSSTGKSQETCSVTPTYFAQQSYRRQWFADRKQAIHIMDSANAARPEYHCKVKANKDTVTSVNHAFLDVESNFFIPERRAETLISEEAFVVG